MKKFILLIAIAATTLAAMARETAAVPDSIPSDSLASGVTLGEIVVQAPRIVRKADMDVLYPSKSAIENSQNGMALLNRLMIPTLTVNEVMGTVRTSGQDVQIRINGRVADINQLKALEPSSVKRIEWIDNPGLRYGDAPAVINVIMANPTLGGSLMLEALPTLTQAFGNYGADLKLNSGRSQWSLGGIFKLTNRIDGYREYSETFTGPDGTSVTRTETPLKGKLSNSMANPWLNYSYINPDKTVVWISLSAFREFNNLSDYRGIMSLSNGSSDLRLRDMKDDHGTTPRFNAYLEQHLPHRQTIVVDFNASLYNGRSSHSYTESVSDTPDTDVNTSIRDNNRTISAEADYIRRWDASRFTAGASYTAQRNRSTYANLADKVFRQHQDKIYFFGEYFHRIRRVSLTGGVGAQYTDIRSVNSGKGSSTWNIRPRVSAAWRINSAHQLRLNFTSWQTTPSLSETNEAPQQIDGFQWQIGNPDLSTYSNYRVGLTYNFDIPRVSGTFGVRYERAPHAIAPSLTWDGERLVTTFENSRGRTDWQFYISPQIEIIPDWLMAQGTVRYTTTRTRGTGYSHRLGNWNGDITVMATHWGFTAMFTWQDGGSRLSGETITTGEKFNIATLSYRHKGFEYTAGIMMPFGHYGQGSESLNRYNTNHYTMRTRAIERLPFIKIAYNLNWGHQKRGADKLINADSDVQQSTAAGR